MTLFFIASSHLIEWGGVFPLGFVTGVGIAIAISAIAIAISILVYLLFKKKKSFLDI